MSLNTRTVQAVAGRPANAWSAGYIGFLRSLLAVDLSILSSTRRSRIVFFFRIFIPEMVRESFI